MRKALGKTFEVVRKQRVKTQSRKLLALNVVHYFGTNVGESRSLPVEKPLRQGPLSQLCAKDCGSTSGLTPADFTYRIKVNLTGTKGLIESLRVAGCDKVG